LQLEFNLGERKIRMARKKAADNGANLGFEEKLWLAADKLRGSMDAAEYKHVVLGLVFLKYISDAFEEQRGKIAAMPGADPEDRDEYRADNVFWVPMEARWTATGDVKRIQDKARDPRIGKFVDDAMEAIEKENPGLKRVLPKDYAIPDLDKTRLGELIDRISTIGMGDEASRSKDVLGRIYEYFPGKFANAEGKGGGEFYTPRKVGVQHKG
jgi:type I restriction enzyme M protein